MHHPACVLAEHGGTTVPYSASALALAYLHAILVVFSVCLFVTITSMRLLRPLRLSVCLRKGRDGCLKAATGLYAAFQ